MHRSVEIVIGRLVTDDAFRAAFQRNPPGVLASLGQLGLELNTSEIRALLDTDLALWDRVAHAIDRRLRKAQLASSSPEPEAN